MRVIEYLTPRDDRAVPSPIDASPKLPGATDLPICLADDQLAFSLVSLSL